MKEPRGAEPDVLLGGYLLVSAGGGAKREGRDFVGILAHATAQVVDRDDSRDATRAEMLQMPVSVSAE